MHTDTFTHTHIHIYIYTYRHIYTVLRIPNTKTKMNSSSHVHEFISTHFTLLHVFHKVKFVEMNSCTRLHKFWKKLALNFCSLPHTLHRQRWRLKKIIKSTLKCLLKPFLWHYFLHLNLLAFYKRVYINVWYF